MFNVDLFPTEQNSKLSENSNSWPETLNIIVSHKYPELSQFVDKVIFSKVDKVRGYAVGYIMMQQDVFRIPFIIHKFILYPLDVYIKSGKYGYLDKKIAPRLVGDSWPFKTMTKNDHRQMFSKVGSCFEVGDITVERIENDPILLKYAELLSETMPEQIVNLGKQAIENDNLNKLAHDQPVLACVHTGDSKDHLTFEYFGKTAGEYRTLQEAKTELGHDRTKAVLAAGELAFGPLIPKNIVNHELPKEQFQFESGSNAQYPKPASISDGAVGTIRGNIYELRDIKDPNVHKNFIFMSTRQTNPIYYVVNSHTSRHIFLTPSEPTNVMNALPDDMQRPSMNKKAGIAFGIYMNDKIFGPFEILTEAQIGNDTIYTIKDGYEYDTFRLHITQHIKQITVDGNDIFVPNTTKLIWLGDTYEHPLVLEKKANIWVRLNASTDKRSFNLIDGGITGLPTGNLQQMGKTKTISALMYAGLSEAEAREAITKAMVDGTYSFQATPTATQTEGQTRAEIGVKAAPSKEHIKVAEVVIKLIDSKNLIKIGVDNSDSDSVELVLGLRLITPETVAKFRLLLPRIENTIDGLCKLLLTKRLGGDEVPVDERKVKTTVEALSDIKLELMGV